MGAMETRLHTDALQIILEGIRAADPEEAVRKALKFKNGKLKVGTKVFDLKGKLYLVGFGKAAYKMAKAASEVLEKIIEKGIISIPKGFKIEKKLENIEIIFSGHPKPDSGSIEAGKKILELANEAGENDIVLILISGGGSALMEYPVEGVSLDDIANTTILLMNSGADIYELNTVRKHLSRVKGGQLAKAIFPATTISLIISDVVGDRIDMIASGPTAPDPTTFQDAWFVLEKYHLLERVPNSVRLYLKKGLKGEASETPKKEDPIFKKVYNHIVASNITSLEKMREKAEKLGYNTLILTSMIQGEAKEVGKVIAALALEAKKTGYPINPPAVILAGGETTVTVKGSGKGGRNQELALSAAIQIKGINGVVIASVGSDGIDGPTDAAGAIVDGFTVIKAENQGMNVIKYLDDNNSYTFFKKVGGLIETGYTGTNVNDFIIAIIA
ncbi:MAG: glycerate kinase [Thermoprotei archaeon]|nr:MAG: glycerate kinase [Thermoprotei archaeon]